MNEVMEFQQIFGSFQWDAVNDKTNTAWQRKKSMTFRNVKSNKLFKVLACAVIALQVARNDLQAVW